MIPVQAQPEPTAFDTDVRKKGLTLLQASAPAPVSRWRREMVSTSRVDWLNVDAMLSPLLWCFLAESELSSHGCNCGCQTAVKRGAAGLFRHQEYPDESGLTLRTGLL